MTPDQLAELKDNATFRKRLAKAMAKHCFRNTKLEDLHAADRIDDEEMKALMIDVVDHCYDYLMQSTRSGDHGRPQAARRVPEWKEPELLALRHIRRRDSSDLAEDFNSTCQARGVARPLPRRLPFSAASISALRLRSPCLEGLRSWPITGCEKYLVFYRVVAKKLEVVRVLHGARELN